MSFKYNRFFASTCLSLAAASFLVSSDARAGFEWTPPEKKEVPVEIIQPEPEVPASAAVPLPVVEEEPVAEAEPDISIKVLDEPVQQTIEEESTVVEVVEEKEADIIEVVERIEEPVIDETVVLEDSVVVEEPAVDETAVLEDSVVAEEVIIIEEQPAVESDVASDTADLAEQPAVEPQIQEEAVLSEDVLPSESVNEQTSEVADVQQDNSLKLDFNPGTATASDSQPVAILPEDTEQDISEVALPNETPLEEAKIETPTENIFWAAEEKFDAIEGFGNDLPLALALRQIVPARYAFSFGEGVNAGTKVSWEGGRPWNEALEAAIAPIGIDFTIQRSNLISLKRSEQPVAEEAEESATSDQASADIENSLSEDTESDIIEVPDITSSDASEIIEIVEEIEEVEEIIEEEVAPAEPSPLDEIYKDVEKLEGAVLETDVSDFPDVPDGKLKSADSEKLEPLADQKKNESLEEASNALDQVNPEETPQHATAEIPEEAISWNDHDHHHDHSHDLDDIIGSREASEDEDSAEIIEIVDDEHIISSEDSLETPAESHSAELDQTLVSSEAIEESVNSLPEIAPAAEAVLSDVIEIEEKAVRTFRSQPSGELLVWEARKGANVKKIIKKWAKKENIELIWHGDRNYRVDKDVFISGTFSNAIEILLTTSVDHAPSYQFNDDPDYALVIDGE